MARRRFDPPLNKTPLATRGGYRFYAVSAFAVRNESKPDEEFGTFATAHEYPHLIPEREVWISGLLAPREAEFFIANALARLAELENGAGADRAYTVGLNADRKLRKRVLGVEYRAGRPHKHIPGAIYRRRYLVLPDEEFPIAVWRVDGCLVRATYKTDYVEGGHGYVYPWVPKDEIWVEEGIAAAEVPYIVTHEYTEHRLMRDEGLDYDRAHEICSRAEYDLRKPDTRKEFPGFTRHKPTKADLPELTAPEFFEYVKRHYARGPLGRAAAAVADAARQLLPA